MREQMTTGHSEKSKTGVREASSERNSGAIMIRTSVNMENQEECSSYVKHTKSTELVMSDRI